MPSEDTYKKSGAGESSASPAGRGVGLGLKLTLLILIAFTFLAGITSWFSINQLRETMIVGMEETADGLGKVVGLASAYQGFFDVDNRKLNQYVESAASLSDVEYAAVLDREGKIITSRGLNREERIALEETGSASEPSEVYEARQPIELDRPVGRLGTIVIGISKARINAQENQIVSTQLKVAAFVSLFTLFFLWILVFSITRPLRVLAEQTRNIGEGNLAEPVMLKTSGEIGVLAASIEFMRANLYRNIEKLGFIGRISHILNESETLYDIAEVLRRNLEDYPIWPWHLAGFCLVGRDTPGGSFHYIPVFPKSSDRTGQVFSLTSFIEQTLESQSTHIRGREGRSQDNQFEAFLLQRNVASDLVVPLISRKRVLGLLYVGFSDENTAFDRDLQNVIKAIGDDITAALDNIYLVADLTYNLQQLRIAHRELKSMDNVKTEFISGVSHELRTPLVAISGYVHMMLDEKLGPLTEMQREGLDTSAKSLERLTVLIDKILSFSSQLTPEDLRLAPHNIADIIEHCYKMEEPRAKDKKINLRISVEPDLPPVMVDEDLIIQVFINLIDNALKFSQQDSVIEVRARKPFKETPERKNRIEVLVRDRGRGIEEQDLKYIFNKFYQTSRASEGHRYTGIGLGLSLVKKIIEQHDCTIEVESQVGVGTTFVFTLPTVTQTTEA